jgi:hypothetical protein
MEPHVMEPDELTHRFDVESKREIAMAAGLMIAFFVTLAFL